jgi:ferrochelatase
MNETIAVLMTNYGGPEGPEDCEPYIRNIFMDPDLIPVPVLLRPWIAKRTARRRAPVLQKSYEAMGRYSPILEQSRAQAEALQAALGDGFRCFVAMRYFRPLIADVCGQIVAEGHRWIVHLPLYPHECRSTTGSSIGEAKRAFAHLDWECVQREVRSFWDRPAYLDALAEGVDHARQGSPAGAPILFSAHGLPLSVAKRDRYPGQIESTARAVCQRLGLDLAVSTDPREVARGAGGLAWQSKVGPMRWLEPSVESVLEAYPGAGAGHVIVVPLSFVSEHSETLYELDVLYGDLAREAGLGFTRVPTLQTHPGLVSALADAVREAVA